MYNAWGGFNTRISNSTVCTDTFLQASLFRYRSYIYDYETNFYYLQSRYYAPETGRFINADSIDYLGANGDLLGYNLYAYCSNNPVTYADDSGHAVETVFDIISLGVSIGDVVLNPLDFFAWAGLIGDIADVVIPFVAGIGEAIDAYRMYDGFVEGTDDIVDAARYLKNTGQVSKEIGAYEIIYKSGQTYVGKGKFKRAIRSARNHMDEAGEIASITWRKSASETQAFIDEYLLMCKHGGPNNSMIGNWNSLNKIWSPGRNMYYNKFGKYII